MDRLDLLIDDATGLYGVYAEAFIGWASTALWNDPELGYG